MNVVVLASAQRRLSEIIHYANANDGHTKAIELLERITARFMDLERFPRGGAIEPLLDHCPGEHRRLIEGHYKIIYRIEKDMVFVTDIFDSRRDPADMIG